MSSLTKAENDKQTALLISILQELELHQEKQQTAMLGLGACEDATFLPRASALSLPSTRPSTPASSAASPTSRSSKSSVTELQPPSRRVSLCLQTALDMAAPTSSLLRPPPGLEALPIRPPPGLEQPSCVVSPIPPAYFCEVAEQRSDGQKVRENGNMDARQNHTELPFSVTTSSFNGVATSEILWRISNPNSRFKSSCGCALISQSFNAGGLNDLRIMFAPGGQWAAEKAQKHKGKNDRKRLTESLPLNGSLQLKFGGETSATEEVQLCFSVGSMQLGPFSACPWKCTSQVYELPSDWRKEVTTSGMIVVGLKIVD